jgi:uncharacterized protein (DUF1800 family)
MAITDSDRSAVAHVLRRLTFTPTGDRVEALVEAGPQAAVEAILASSYPEAPPPDPTFGTKDDNGVLVKWWTDLMTSSEHQLVEKMTWLWHNHLTSSLGKGGDVKWVYQQNQLIRKYALGNFRQLMKELTVDPSMLIWLDGNWSSGDAPNENYGRELLELFTLGRGNYTEQDIRQIAKALAGWGIEDDKSSLHEDMAHKGELTIFDKTAVFTKDTVIDHVVDQPACGPFIVGLLHEYFIGTVPNNDRRDELVKIFRESDTEIRPVVENIVRHPSFLDRANRYAHIRGPVEWRAAAQEVLEKQIDWNVLWEFGQVPFFPPNVSGWPHDDRWLGASTTLLRARTGRDHSWDSTVIDTDDYAMWALRKSAIFDASKETVDAIRGAVARVENRREKTSIALSLTVNCPEFVLA